MGRVLPSGAKQPQCTEELRGLASLGLVRCE